MLLLRVLREPTPAASVATSSSTRRDGARGTASWTRSLHEYRPTSSCTSWGTARRAPRRLSRSGTAAPVMQQQSIGLQAASRTCAAAWERAAVAQRYGVRVRADAFTDIADSVTHADASGSRDRAWRAASPTGRSVGGGGPQGSAGLDAGPCPRTPPDRGVAVQDLTGSVTPRASARWRCLAPRGFPDARSGRGTVLRGQLASLLAASLGLDATDVSCAPADSPAASTPAHLRVVRAGIAGAVAPTASTAESCSGSWRRSAVTLLLGWRSAVQKRRARRCGCRAGTPRASQGPRPGAAKALRSSVAAVARVGARSRHRAEHRDSWCHAAHVRRPQRLVAARVACASIAASAPRRAPRPSLPRGRRKWCARVAASSKPVRASAAPRASR
jgi:hypothetical protein